MRRKMQHIGWFMLLGLALAACTHPAKVVELVETPTVELSAIDSLMWHQPDSAFALLLEFAASPKADSLDVFNGHYCQLLISELLYKNDYEQNNRPDLLLAVTYFDSLLVLADTRGVSLRKSGRRDAPRASAQNTTATIAFLDARAHYINGVGYYENDGVVEACKEYMKALDVMEEHFAENELVEKKAKFMALTYTHLTGLFSDIYLHEQAIYFGKESLAYYDKYDAPSRHIAWILCEIGSHYDMMNDYDSAELYYHKSLIVLTDTNNLTHRDATAYLAFLSYKTGELPWTSLNQLKKLIGQSKSKKETLSRCAIVGEIYYHEKQFDSAWNYLTKVFHESQSVDSKKQVAEWLVDICKEQGREEDIIVYASFLVPFATQNEDKGMLKSQLTELYKTFSENRLERLHQMETKKHAKQVITLFGSSLFVMLTTIILYVRNKRHKRKLETQIESERQTHKMQQAAISGRLKKSNEALRIQKKETNDLAKEMAIQQRQTEWNHLSDFMNESICNDIVTALRGKQIKREAKSGDYPELHLSDAQLHELNVAVEKHFHGFEKTLTDLYPKISRNAMNQCLLYLVNMEDVQIAALLSCDYSTVKRRSAKLKQAFGTEKELRQFIREFVL